MGSFKQLKSSDVITVPVIANKSWNFNYCPIPSNDPYISYYNGVNLTDLFTPNGEYSTNGQYDRLTYRQINQLFYHRYSGSLNTSSLASSLYYESASEQHPSASFFNFNNDPAFIANFPTGANEEIKVIQISPQAYGKRILPYSFRMSSSAWNFIDDGKGNLYSGSTHVGNIFYPEGVVVITNQDLQSAFVLPPVAYDNTTSIIRSNYPNPATVSLSPLANDDLRGNTLINQSIQLFGGDIGFFSTGSNNTVSMSFSGLGVGTYQTFYTFLVTGSYCAPLVSNTGSIVITVLDPDCEFELSISLDPPTVFQFLPQPWYFTDFVDTGTTAYLYGNFATYSYNNTSATNIIRLNSDLTVDATFNYGSGFDSNLYAYQSIISQSGTSKIYATGNGTLYSGSAFKGIIRLNSNGTIDSTFNVGSGLTGGPSQGLGMAESTSGDITVVGSFTAYSGSSSPRIVRIQSNGTKNTSFNPGVGFSGGGVSPISILVNSDNGIITTGYFTSYSGSSFNGIVKTTSTGTISSSFDPGTGFNIGPAGNPYRTNGLLRVGTETSFYTYGYSTEYSGSTINYIAKITETGSLDPSFNSGTGFDGPIAFGKVIWGNKLVLAGDDYYTSGFSSYDGNPTSNLIVLNSDGSPYLTFNTLYKNPFTIGDYLYAELPDQKITLLAVKP